ncbi:hypothetical protein BJV82DRAFT_633482 [Fennellomyces sp. T-0311]|nr:hypothetical protein BJV82DRAFT_633482 [Fennellomyces sp. T-0311]
MSEYTSSIHAVEFCFLHQDLAQSAQFLCQFTPGFCAASAFALHFLKNCLCKKRGFTVYGIVVLAIYNQLIIHDDTMTIIYRFFEDSS